MSQHPARSQPTPQAYAELQLAYDLFNGALFGGFSRNRFANLDGQLTDEIALNRCLRIKTA